MNEVKLGEVSIVQRGLTFSKKDTTDYSKNIVLRATNIDLRSGNLDLDELKYLKDDFVYDQKYKLEKSSILICFSSGSKSHLGKVAFVENDIEMAYGGFIGKITPKETIDPKYLFYNLRSEEYIKYIGRLTDGANINNLKMVDLLNYSLRLPPLSEQKQIVETLDKAFEKIDKAITNIERNIENAEELFKSKAKEIFNQNGSNYNQMTLGDIGKVSMCKRILKKETNTTGGIPFYKIGTFGKKANAYISKKNYEEYRNKYSFPKKGDVLISASGTIGRRVIYDGEPAYFQDSNIVWIDNNELKVLNNYLYHFYGICEWNPSKGATISRLYNDDLRRIRISFPNKEVQSKLVKQLVSLKQLSDSLYSDYIKKLNNLKELKKSILEKAFKGELTSAA